MDLFRQNGPKWTILVHFGLANAKIQFGIRPFWPKWSFGPFWTILVQYIFRQYRSHSLNFPALFVMPKSPESEILVKFSPTPAKTAAKNWRNLSPILVLQVPGKSGRKKFHEKSSTNFTSHETKFFHCETGSLWGTTFWGAPVFRGSMVRSEIVKV